MSSPSAASAGLSIPQLEALIAIVDYGSYTAAADVLRISQPALSRRVQSLEKALGVQLFTTTGRVMSLTETGRTILGPARRALRETSTLESLAASNRTLASGFLRVTGLPSLMATVVPDHVGRFHRRFPGVRLDVLGAQSTDDLIDSVRLARADLAFGAIEGLPSDLEIVPLHDQEFSAVVAAQSEGGNVVTADFLRSRTLVTLPQGTSIRALTDEVYRSQRVTPPHIITTTQRDALVRLAIAANGITIVPDVLAQAALVSSGRIVDFERPVLRSIGLVHERDALRSPLVRHFIATVTTSDAELPTPLR
ncbi:LysR family transcriptional regulator [Paramicrobacterium chengjingii]|uniref:LysR family transcriptional regulator n=1 Tax=Paramicrobacterium chengjingii TaxID=2769067 RepID=A0ABX6YHV1_9MICO|nr:LysR family transcriptional regulator [Microbacterium chengjingii]QPZ38368.1 LysR family transcriptional regulator [Microbacterium chengjingii]